MQQSFKYSNKRLLSTTTMKKNVGGGNTNKAKPNPIKSPQKLLSPNDENTILGLGNDNELEFGIPTTWNPEDTLRPSGSSNNQKTLKTTTKTEDSGNPKSFIPIPRRSIGGLAAVHETLNERKKSIVPKIGPPSSEKFQHMLSDEDIKLNMEPDRVVPIDFHKSAVLTSLKLLENTSRVFIRKHKTNRKRLDLLDEKGTLIYYLLDFSTPAELSIFDMNYCLMKADGTSQLLVMQGDPGFLGLNGDIVVRYPGSLPGDQELIFGSVTQRTPMCSFKTQYLIRDAEDNVVYELIDRNKNCILSPFRKYSQSFFEMMKPKALPTVFGRIEERHLSIDVDPEVIGPDQLLPQKRRSSMGPGKRNSVAGSNKRSSIALNGSKRSSIVDKPILTANVSHTNFCIGFMNKLDYQTRGLLIAAHILLNYDFFGKKKFTRYCFGMGLVISLMFVVIVGGAALVILLATL